MSMTGPMTLGETLATVSDGAVVNVTVWTVRAELDNVGDFGAKLVPAQGVLPKAMMFHAVEPNGPAHVAGLEDGDVLVAVGGTRADGHFAQIATYYAQTRPPGTQVVLRVRRVGVDADLEFELKVRR
jgi:S1-C subfamily serine protease